MPLEELLLNRDQLWNQTKKPFSRDRRQIFKLDANTYIASQIGGAAILPTLQAFTLNGDGTQNWGVPLSLGVDGATGGGSVVGAVIDASRFLVAWDQSPTTSGQIVAVVSVSGLSLTLNPHIVLTPDGDAMGGIVVLDGFNAIIPWRRFIVSPAERITYAQRVLISGTTLTAGEPASVIRSTGSTHDPVAAHYLSPTRALLFASSNFAQAWWAVVDLQGATGLTTSFLANLFGGSGDLWRKVDLIDNGVYAIQGTQSGSTTQRIKLLHIDPIASSSATEEPSIALTGPTELGATTLQPAYASFVNGRQITYAWSRSSTLDHNIYVESIEVCPNTLDIFELSGATVTGVAPGPPFSGGYNEEPRHGVSMGAQRGLFVYETLGSDSDSFINGSEQRVFYVELVATPPLRWRQRNDCLTPGTAVPCMCLFLNCNPIGCIPPFWIRITSSVQFGGRVGPRNTYA